MRRSVLIQLAFYALLPCTDLSAMFEMSFCSMPEPRSSVEGQAKDCTFTGRSMKRTLANANIDPLRGTGGISIVPLRQSKVKP